MGRVAGRNGRLYAGIGSAGTAEPIAFINKFSASWTTDKYDVTAFGDANKTYVSGLPDFQATYTGFYDTATAQLYTAATDGVARKFYLYDDTVGSPAQYWFGTAFFDFNIDVPVDGPVAISGTFAAATAIPKVG
jgi:hypothetical protein